MTNRDLEVDKPTDFSPQRVLDELKITHLSSLKLTYDRFLDTLCRHFRS